MSNTLFPTSFTVTASGFVQLATYLESAGLPDVNNSSVAAQDGYIKNNSASIDLQIGFGDSAPTDYATLPPLNALFFQAGMNVNNIWLQAASSTVSVDFVQGASNYQPPTINGVIGEVIATENQIPKVDGDGNLVASSASDDGSTFTTTDALVVGGKISPATNDGAALGDATHNFSDLFLASGAVINYANGNVALTQSSGVLTMGTGELRITTPGTNAASVPTIGSTSTLTNKTFVAPVLGVATGTSLAVTGLIATSSPTAAFGFATGAGGAQTQSTDKSTTVVSNTNTTAITLNNASLAAATIVSFTFTNSAITATDHLLCTHQSAGTSGAYTINAFPGAGSAVVSVRNNTAGALAEAIVIRISILKAVSA